MLHQFTVEDLVFVVVQVLQQGVRFDALPVMQANPVLGLQNLQAALVDFLLVNIPLFHCFFYGLYCRNQYQREMLIQI